jgi:peptidoglycan/LPS O-acetylase OafA/YrhL
MSGGRAGWKADLGGTCIARFFLLALHTSFIPDPMSARSHEGIWTPSTPLRHMAQLDGLRAVAVSAVMLQHFWLGPSLFDFGAMGVRLFFVLSGFLITGILLKSRELLDTGEQRPSFALGRFYIRRFLRIFPLYYAVLLGAWLLRLWGTRGEMGWHLAYLTNVDLYLRGRWWGDISHFWSLAVEEQFYLCWPLIILLVPRRRLPAVALGAVLAAPLFRFAASSITGNTMGSILPFGCLDSLCLGAYLAMGADAGLRDHPLVRPVHGRLAWAGLVGVVASAISVRMGIAPLFWKSITDFAVALPCAWLVSRAATGLGGVPGRFLELRPIRYLGMISYGLYIYHYVLQSALPRLATLAGHPHLLDVLAPDRHLTVWYPVFYASATVVVASVSWHAFEGPINLLKARFEYRRPPAVEPEIAAAEVAAA